MEDDEVASPSDLPAPPWVFRGSDMARILALSDGVFAFAMTLLVLGLALPAASRGGTISGGQIPVYLRTAFVPAVFAYILTFFVIGLWWQSHHLIFGYIREYDRTLVRANSVFLLTIAVLPFATIVLVAAGTNPVGVGFYAVTQVAAGLSLAGIWSYSSGRAGLVHERVPREWRGYLSRITLVTPVFFAVSIPVAVFVPFVTDGFTSGELVWLGAFIVPIAFRHKARAARPNSTPRPPVPP